MVTSNENSYPLFQDPAGICRFLIKTWWFTESWVERFAMMRTGISAIDTMNSVVRGQKLPLFSVGRPERWMDVCWAFSAEFFWPIEKFTSWTFRSFWKILSLHISSSFTFFGSMKWNPFSHFSIFTEFLDSWFCFHLSNMWIWCTEGSIHREANLRLPVFHTTRLLHRCWARLMRKNRGFP